MWIGKLFLLFGRVRLEAVLGLIVCQEGRRVHERAVEGSILLADWVVLLNSSGIFAKIKVRALLHSIL